MRRPFAAVETRFCSRMSKLGAGTSLAYNVSLSRQGCFDQCPALFSQENGYLAVDCAKCGEAIAFSEALSPEEAAEIKFQTISGLRCPSCDHVDTYHQR